MSNHLTFGYCTNVHAGADLAAAKANLLKYAVPVRDKLCPDSKLLVGLWLAEDAANSLAQDGQIEQFRDWLAENALRPYTLNGFPQGDFHQPVVKHAVYQPTWAEDRRFQYTLTLAKVLDGILPPGEIGSISTLPLGWPSPKWQEADFRQAADNLRAVARSLDQLANQSGREIVIAIESEPGCVLNTAQEITDFFTQYLFGGDDETIVRRHITVCHDVCHSGVMFEPQAEALGLYRNNGIRIGKVQVSSAVHVPWDDCQSVKQSQDVLAQLQTFNEPKYLHQTSRSAGGKLAELADDLPIALDSWITGPETQDRANFPAEPWRVHFHVPIFVDKFDALATTQSDIRSAVTELETHRDMQLDSHPWFVGHYEVETYAWPVLPASLAAADLSSGIAQELSYFSDLLTTAQRPNSCR